MGNRYIDIKHMPIYCKEPDPVNENPATKKNKRKTGDGLEEQRALIRRSERDWKRTKRP